MMSNLPYRTAKKPTRCQYEFTRSWAPVWGFLGFLAAGAAFLLWPAVFCHGEKQDAFTGQEHWAWDIHSTVACCIWWGVLVFVAAIILLPVGSPRVRALTPVPPDFPDLRDFHGNPFLDPPEGLHPPY